jgi:hypothetical protein
MSNDDFVAYVLSFYGKGGLYAFRPVMRNSEARYALGVLLKAASAGDIDFAGDTWDRELARDIIILMRDPTMHVGPAATELFHKYAHKRWQSRRPNLKIVKRYTAKKAY